MKNDKCLQRWYKCKNANINRKHLFHTTHKHYQYVDDNSSHSNVQWITNEAKTKKKQATTNNQKNAYRNTVANFQPLQQYTFNALLGSTC